MIEQSVGFWEFEEFGWEFRDGLYWLCWDASLSIRYGGSWEPYEYIRLEKCRISSGRMQGPPSRKVLDVPEGNEIEAMIWTGGPQEEAPFSKSWVRMTLVSVREDDKLVLKPKTPYIWKA